MAKEIMTVTRSEFTGLNHVYDPTTGTMTIRDGGTQIWSGRASEGDAFVVSNDQDHWHVIKRQYPHRKNHLLMWIMGFPQGKRFDDRYRALQALDDWRETHMDAGYQEYEYSGTGWMFLFCTTDEHPEPWRIAAWVTQNVDRRMALEILGNKDLAVASADLDKSIDPILRDRFGFQPQDITDLRHELM